MRDVVKNQYQPRQPQRQQPQKRRRRKRNLSLYYLMIFILVSIVGVVLSLTVFFKISKINVVGTTQYDTNSIIACSKINIGDNMLRTNYDNAKERILKNLIYIDDVTIKKTLNCEINIIVEPSVPSVNVAYNGGYLLISKTGKILEELSQPQEGLVIFKGYEPNEIAVGEKICSEDSEKEELLKTICNQLDKLEITSITEVDITDRYNILMIYENRVNIEIGSASDLAYKINYAEALLTTNINKNKEGTLFMLGDNEASFVEKQDLDKYEQNYQSATVTSETSAESNTSITSEVTQTSKATAE